MKTNTLSLEFVKKSWDVKPFLRSAFVQDVKRRKKYIQVVRIGKKRRFQYVINISQKKKKYPWLLIFGPDCYLV